MLVSGILKCTYIQNSWLEYGSCRHFCCKKGCEISWENASTESFSLEDVILYSKSHTIFCFVLFNFVVFFHVGFHFFFTSKAATLNFTVRGHVIQSISRWPWAILKHQERTTPNGCKISLTGLEMMLRKLKMWSLFLFHERTWWNTKEQMTAC